MPENESKDEQLAATLRARRPDPSRSFAAELRDRLLARDARSRRPEHLWRLVAVYVCVGLGLLGLAALGAMGGGPFGS